MHAGREATGKGSSDGKGAFDGSFEGKDTRPEPQWQQFPFDSPTMAHVVRFEILQFPCTVYFCSESMYHASSSDEGALQCIQNIKLGLGIQDIGIQDIGIQEKDYTYDI